MATEVPTPKPRLVAVDGQVKDEAPARDAEESPTPSRRGVWVLGILLVLALVALGFQTRRVEGLSGQVSALTADLGQAREALAAYQGRLEEVRVSVDDLQSRLAALDALVTGDPLAPASGAPAAE